MLYLGNAISGQMLPEDCLLKKQSITAAEVPAKVKSVIGHADTAVVVGDLLGFPVPMNREFITLEQGDTLYVAQLVGGRLPEGSTTLPEGFEIKFYKYTLEYVN
jgi:hypothetical protein